MGAPLIWLMIGATLIVVSHIHENTATAPSCRYEDKTTLAYSCGYVAGQVESMKILNKDFTIVVPAHCAEYVTAAAAKGFR